MKLIKLYLILCHFKFQNVEALKKMLTTKKDDMDDDDKTEEFLSGFYDHANKTIKFVGEKIDAINVQYDDIIKFLGSKKMDIEKFVNIMREFYLKTMEGLKVYKDKIAKEEKLKKLEEDKRKKMEKKKKK